MLYGTPPVVGDAITGEQWTPPGDPEPLPSPGEMREIALESIATESAPTDGELLRKAIRQFVLVPWVTAQAERMCGEVTPALFEQLHNIVNAAPADLVTLIKTADAIEKARASSRAAFEAAEAEYIRAKEELDRMEKL
jgi:hypothetical protein